MKRILIYCLVLILVAGLLAGCTDGGNVSTNKDGMVESSATTPSTSRPTTSSSANDPMDDNAVNPSSEGNSNGGNGGAGENGGNTGGGENGGIGGGSEESTENSMTPSGRSSRKTF